MRSNRNIISSLLTSLCYYVNISVKYIESLSFTSIRYINYLKGSRFLNGGGRAYECGKVSVSTSSTFLFLFFLTLSACNPSPRKPFIRTYTPLQQQYLAQAPLEQRVYIEACMANKYSFWTSCQDAASRLNQPHPPKSSPSITETAIGTAVGYGAAKMLLGK